MPTNRFYCSRLMRYGDIYSPINLSCVVIFISLEDYTWLCSSYKLGVSSSRMGFSATTSLERYSHTTMV